MQLCKEPVPFAAQAFLLHLEQKECLFRLSVSMVI